MITALKSKLLDAEFAYDGTQLRSLFGYLDHGLLGDSVVAWIGPCSVSFDHMVDGEDLLARSPIAGGRMLHFVFELFHRDLLGSIAFQRLFAALVLDLIRERTPHLSSRLKRDGDDLYLDDGKLSISIATASPLSALIHFAINCTNQGTPVKTASFEDLGIEPRAFALEALKRATTEFASIQEASMKVKWVK